MKEVDEGEEGKTRNHYTMITEVWVVACFGKRGRGYLYSEKYLKYISGSQKATKTEVGAFRKYSCSR
jgi:hypothetical protein